MQRREATTIVLVSSCLFAACGGGDGGTTSVPPSPPRTGYDARFTITVPNASTASAKRLPRYLSAATRSLAIDVSYASGTPTTTVANVTPGAGGCTTGTSGTTCAVDVTVQSGAQQFAVRAYDGRDATGNLLGTTVLAAPASSGAPVVDVDVTLDGVVHAIALSLQGGPFTAGTPGTRTLLVTASDADGNTIVAPGNFSPAIVLSASDAAVRLSATTVNTPATVVTATYDGTPSAHTTLVATAGSASTIGATLTAVGASTPAPSPSPSPTAAPTAAPTGAPVPSPSPTVLFTVN